MRIRSGYVLRAALMLDAIVMAVVGFPLWGSYRGPLESLGIWLPADHSDLIPWHAIGMAGLFGGALLAFAAALAALAMSRDHERTLMATPLVLCGTFVLGVIAFAKVTGFDFPPAGYWMVLALVVPGCLLLFAFVFDLRGHPQPPPEVARLRDAAGQAERTRLARDLHDSVKQQLYSIQAHLAAADARWEQDGSGARVALAHARTGARDAMREMAALLDRLQADPVEAQGLIDALRRQCEAIGFQTGAIVTTEFGTLPPAGRVESEVMNGVFRIGQEALANVARHARPLHVSVTAGIETASRGREEFVLRVSDDGKGFDVNAAGESSSMGLRNMRERAREVDARLIVTSRPGQGTSIEVGVPVPASHAAATAAAWRLMIACGLPTAALLLWSAASPVWRPFLRPFIQVGLGAAILAGVSAVSLRWWRR